MALHRGRRPLPAAPPVWKGIRRGAQPPNLARERQLPCSSDASSTMTAPGTHRLSSQVLEVTCALPSLAQRKDGRDGRGLSHLVQCPKSCRFRGCLVSFGWQAFRGQRLPARDHNVQKNQGLSHDWTCTPNISQTLPAAPVSLSRQEPFSTSRHISAGVAGVRFVIRAVADQAAIVRS
jgi:hypothetical protein